MEGHTQPPEDQAEEPALKKQRTVGYGILSHYVLTLQSIMNIELMDMETEGQA